MRKELVKRKETPKTIGDCFNEFHIVKKAELLNDKYCVSEFTHFCNLVDRDFSSDVKTLNYTTIALYIEKMNLLHYKSASINHYLSAVRTVLYFFMNNGWLENFKISLVKCQEEKLKTYSEQELAYLCKKPNKNASFTEWRSWAIISFLIATGCRASTLNAIERNDIDFKNQEVTYRHLKNKKVSIIPLSNAIIKSLNDFNQVFDLSESKYLFCEVNLDKMTVGALEKSISIYCKKRNVEYKGIHTFRHTFASLWIRANGNPMTLQKFLTHSTLDMTRKYIHLFSDTMRKDLEIYNPLDNLKQNSREYKITKCV